MDDLEQIRRAISAIDDQILKSLAGRRELAGKIIAQKAQAGLPLRDPRREEEILARLIQSGKELGLDSHLVTRVFHEIIDDSVRSQELYLLGSSNAGHHGIKRVAFQGIEGAYSHLAAKKHFARTLDQTRLVGYPSFEEVLEALEKQEVDYGFLPIENTTAGSINEVFDLLAQTTSLHIIGEEVFRVEHCLLGIADAQLSSIRRVYSHPQALKQCMKFLSTLANCQIEYYADTAMAARKIKEDQDPQQAAVASEAAAQQYGLVILQRDLADQRENYTRFLVIAREPINVDARIPSKTSLVLAVPHEEGSLLKALLVFHGHKINLTKLDGSRPRPGAPFQYLFNVDFEGNIADVNVRAALDDLRGATTFLKILGTYPVEARGRTAPSMQAIVPKKRQDSEAAPTRDARTGAGARTASQGGSHRLAGRETKPDGTIIDVRGVRIGGPDLVVFAGPASIESREHVLACARHVRECGGRVLRCGSLRHGAGKNGLDRLVEAGRAYDLPVIAEVTSPADVGPTAKLADLLLVGGRALEDADLLEAVGKVNRPVVLERAMTSSIDDLLNAAEHILSHGNQQVILCEHGVRAPDSNARVALDLGAIPTLRRLTHLPVLVNPTEAAGQRPLVAPLALAARAVGPHGLMLEVHPNPDTAPTAGSALSFPEFADLMHELYANRARPA